MSSLALILPCFQRLAAWTCNMDTCSLRVASIKKRGKYVSEVTGMQAQLSIISHTHKQRTSLKPWEDAAVMVQMLAWQALR